VKGVRPQSPARAREKAYETQIGQTHEIILQLSASHVRDRVKIAGLKARLARMTMELLAKEMDEEREARDGSPRLSPRQLEAELLDLQEVHLKATSDLREEIIKLRQDNEALSGLLESERVTSSTSWSAVRHRASPASERHGK